MGLFPDQLESALQAVKQSLATGGAIDFGELGKQMGVPPERAAELFQTVAEAHVALITKNVFGGDVDLHSAFVDWVAGSDPTGYAKASEACARTQSSAPMKALVDKHRSWVRAEAAKARQAREQKEQQKEAARWPDPMRASREFDEMVRKQPLFHRYED